MKRLSVFLAIGFLGMALCGTGFAAPGSTELASEAGVPAFGPTTDVLAVDAPEWGEPTDAVEFTPDASLPPADTGDLAGAQWISTDPATPDTEPGTIFRRFQDSFTPPCTGSNVTGKVFAAANESAKIYLNIDTELVSPDVTAIKVYEFEPAEGENTLDFIVQNQVVAETTEVNPSGVIYKAVINFDLPNVQWRPPLVRAKRALLKHGTTLPIKFRLVNEDGIIHTREKVYVSITDPAGNEVVKFLPGRGARNLRFAPGSGQYIVNFKTKIYPALQVGTVYTITVKDLCSEDALTPPITFQLFGKKPHHPKPPHPKH